jgi:hypothetical protein
MGANLHRRTSAALVRQSRRAEIMPAVEPEIDQFVMAITSAEAILWHTTPTNGLNYRMLRVSPVEPQCLNCITRGSGSRLR